MISPDRIRRLSAESIVSADRSHLEPPPVKDDSLSSRVNWVNQKFYFGSSFFDSPRGIELVNKIYIDHEALSRKNQWVAEQQLNSGRLAACAHDGSPEFKFNDKNRQSLPGKFLNTAVNLYLSTQDAKCLEMAEKFGASNTQTNDAIASKLIINKRDFLAR